MAKLPFRTNRTRATPEDVVVGFYLANGQVTPIGTKSAGAFGHAIQSQVRARRELMADDTGLALAYAAAPTANRCVDLLATKVAGMPHGVYRKSDKTLIEDHPLMRALRLSRRIWGKNVLYVWEHSLMLHGEVYFEKVRNGFGQPSAIRWLNPIVTEPQIDQGRIIAFEYSGDDQIVLFDPDDVIYDRTHNPLDDWRGLSPMQVALTAANININYQEYINAFYRNDSTPGGILSARQNTTINKSDAERLLKFWQDQFQGVRNKFRTAFMPAPLEYQQVQQAPSEASMKTVREAKRTICEVFGVPIALVDHDESRFQLGEQPPKLLYENKIIPDCDAIAEVMNDEVLPFFDDSGEVYFGFDYDQIRAMLDDQVKRATAINARLLSGNITVNEARMKFGDKAVSGGDVFFIPKAQQPVQQSDLPRLTEIIKEAQREPIAQGQPEERRVPRQNDPGQELRAWQKKALNSLKRARHFTPYVLPASVAAQVKADLLALPDDADRKAIKAVFVSAERELKAILELDDPGALVERLMRSGLEDVLVVD